MGVTGLWKLIEPSGKRVPLETLENKILAIDISIWIHQVVKGFQDNKGNAVAHAHLLGLFNRLCKLLYYRIKPIFVFDGTVPQIKKDTITKRYQKRNKILTEADRLHELLMQTLAKEKAVQQALGATESSLLLKSPQKKSKSERNQKDDLFKLPELPVIPEENINESQTSIGSSNSSDNSWDEKNLRYSYNNQLQSIDVTSKHFLNLPADIRHEILVDIKETRKESSWGKLHELPAHLPEFSTFQMKRLLKRRQVQMSLEEAEKEMGGKSLTFSELQNFLSEEGVVSTAANAAKEKIDSDENTRFLLIRDLKKTMEEAKKREEIKEQLKEEELKKQEIIKLELEQAKEAFGDEVEDDLQLAIQLSLQDDGVYKDGDYDCTDKIKLNREQRDLLKDSAKTLAKGYLIEYGGMNETDFNDFLNSTQDKTKDISFKYNDLTPLRANNIETEETSPEIQDFTDSPENEKTEINPESYLNIDNISKDDTNDSDQVHNFLEVGIMSDESDSDFEIVPNEETRDNRFNWPRSETAVSSAANESKNIQIKLDFTKSKPNDLEEDMFADVFSPHCSIAQPRYFGQPDYFSSDSESMPSNFQITTEVIIHRPISDEVDDETDKCIDQTQMIKKTLAINKSTIGKTEEIIYERDLSSSPIVFNKVRNRGGNENVMTNCLNQNQMINKTLQYNKSTNVKTEKLLSAKDLDALPIILDNVEIPSENEKGSFEFVEQTQTMKNILQYNQSNDVKIEEIFDYDNPNENEKVLFECVDRIEMFEKTLKINESNNDGTEEIVSETDLCSSPIIFRKVRNPIEIAVLKQNIESILEKIKGEVAEIHNINLDDIKVNKKIIGTADTDEENLTIQNLNKANEDVIIIDDNKSETDQTTPIKNIKIVNKSSGSSMKEKGYTKTNSNVKKTLFDDEEPQNSVETVADILRENKSREELQEIAANLATETRNIEIERNRQDRMAVDVTEKMNRECMALLKLFGMPYICAPMEAEAQCAFLNAMNITDGTITDDSDIWLFGGQTVYKNFFNQKKHVLEFKMEAIKKSFNVDRQKLIQLAFLVGSDYTSGIKGIGAVTALEILATFPSTPIQDMEVTENMSILSSLRKFKDWHKSGRKVGPGGKTVLKNKLKNIDISESFPNFAIADAYLNPKVDENDDPFSWGVPDIATIIEFTQIKFGWSRLKTEEILHPILKRTTENQFQTSIKSYFKVTSSISRTDLKLSKRVQKAVNKMSDNNIEDESDEPKIKKLKEKFIIKTNKNIEIPNKIKQYKPKRIASTSIENKNAEPIVKAAKKNLNLPSSSTSDSSQNIPQREKDIKEMEKKKEVAAALFKQTKNSNQKLKK